MEYLHDLRSSLNIPSNLNAFGVPRHNLRLMAEMALKDPTAGGNPIALNLENVMELYESCF